MMKYILLAMAVILIIALIVITARAIINANIDYYTIRKYNAKMNNLRKEIKIQEAEKQRKIRGEEKDAPKYAAGDDMDRIRRN